MSTDFENELRDLFREKAGEAPLATPNLPASAPRQVLRRGRVHQVGTVLGSAIVVVALILGSVAGLTRILGEGEDDRDVGDSGYEVFQRTVTVEAFTVGSPSDWFLVNQWPLSMLIAVEGSGGSSSSCVAVGDVVQECDDTVEETPSPIPVPRGLPMLQLSNVDLGLGTNACEAGLGAGTAVLYVAYDQDVAANPVAPSLDPFPPGEPGLPPAGDGPCGPGRYAHFTVNGEPFFSWVGVGAGVSNEDREIVETSYEMMSAIPDWTPTQPDHSTPGYVIAGGTSTDGPWQLEVRPGNDVEMTLFVDGTTGRVDVSLGSEPVSWCCKQITDPTRAADVLFGAVEKASTTVFFRSDDERGDIPATVLPLPPTFRLNFDLFFIEGTGGLVGDVIALGLDQTTPSPTTDETPGDVVSLSGGSDEHTWIVGFTGSFDDGSACIRVRLDTDGSDPLCPGAAALRTSFAGRFPSMHGWLTSYYLLAGSVPLEVDEIRFVDTDGQARIRELQCTTGPIGWTNKQVCVIRLPAEGSGTLEYLDADGNVVFEDGMGWAAAEAGPLFPAPVTPVHGGTYWAVYPWVGAAGSPEANDVSAQLLDDFGIEAFPGDLACDQGAAEALGTNAEQGIGVYFETGDEANAFADQAGLLGHEADPVIARVTTYCLD